MDVSVIIINYNTCQMTQNCIDSVHENTTDINYEIILVDNASIDGSKEHFEKEKNLSYVYSFENMGFGRANNVGMMLAKGKYIFLLNSDTLLENNAIKLFYDFAESHEKNAFYGCWLKDSANNTIHSGAKIPTVKSILTYALSPYLSFYRGGYIDIAKSEITCTDKECTPFGFVTGADLFFHRSIYEKTGGFDHQFFLYYEETDWQRRCKRNGINSYVIRGPQILHLIGGSNSHEKGEANRKLPSENKMLSILMKSQHLYVKKHYSSLIYLLYRVLYIILEFPVLMYCKIVLKQRISKPLKVLLG